MSNDQNHASDIPCALRRGLLRNDEKIGWRHTQFNYGAITGEKRREGSSFHREVRPPTSLSPYDTKRYDSNYLRDSRLRAWGKTKKIKLNTLRVIEKRKYAAGKDRAITVSIENEFLVRFII